MPVRLLRQVIGNCLLTSPSLSQEYRGYHVAFTVLRHFGADHKAIETIREEWSAYYNKGATDDYLTLPTELIQKYGILDGEYLEVFCHTVIPAGYVMNYQRQPAPFPILPNRTIDELDFDPGPLPEG